MIPSHLQEHISRLARNVIKDKILNIKDVGTLKYDPGLEHILRNTLVTKTEISTMLIGGEFNVRKDDLISIYEVKTESNEFYIFIFEPLELFAADYLIGAIKLKDDEISSRK
jgi:hypothetical protein